MRRVEYHPAAVDLFVINPTLGLLAAAWKSVDCRTALLLNTPWRISTAILPCVVKGFVPVRLCFLILSVTPVMIALSGRELVLKDRITRYCRRVTVSPNRKVTAPALMTPP